MKTRLQTIAIALVVCALLGSTALAGGKSRNVNFDVDVTVGDTLIKKGDYELRFDDKSQELTIRRNGKVIAQTAASLAESKDARKYRAAYTTLVDGSGARLLSSVDMGGKYAVIAGEKIAAARSAAKDGQTN
ncbi:MAG TPA: hypothetical protein VGX48_12090 [Pyrinomonadaceae bacterium]|jgi:hypothetical protein|nr:hypothetical protein [Pyrinomonadaceae bacterium]